MLEKKMDETELLEREEDTQKDRFLTFQIGNEVYLSLIHI